MIDKRYNILKRIVDHWRTIARKKRLAAEIIGRSYLPVKSGFWRIHPEFSRSFSVPRLPPPLDGVKKWGRWRNGKVLKSFVRLSEILIYPWLAYATRPAGAEFAADVVLVNRLFEPVAFDLSAKKVIRHMTKQGVREFETGVSHLSKMYSCPPFQIDHDTGYVIEDMISGSAFSVASASQRVASVTQFLNGLQAAQSMAIDEQAIFNWRTASDDLLLQLPVDRVLHKKIIESLNEIILKAKTSWVHGDLFGDNIIIDANKKAFVIDYDKSGVAPSFTDVMTLLVFEARTLRSDLMDTFFDGRFDQEFAGLGCALAGDDALAKKVSAFVAWLGWKLTTEEFSAINMSRFFSIINGYIDREVKG